MPTSQQAPTNLPGDGTSKASFRKKQRSRMGRAKKRQAEAQGMGYAPRGESIKRALHKHVAPSDPVKSKLSIKNADMASSGYIGLRGKKSKKLYFLEELVGVNSKFHFLLIEWDGVYVVLGTLSATGSLLYQNTHPDLG
jgi:hypothetical protein